MTDATDAARPEPPDLDMRDPLDPDMFDPVCSLLRDALPRRRLGAPPTPSRQWGRTGMVVRCLEGGPRRFTELRTPLKAVTPKVLSETLRAMQRDGLLTRTAYAENRPASSTPSPRSAAPSSPS